MSKHDPDRELYLVMVGWDKFQHPDVLRSGRPLWIKNYTDLLRRDEYRRLSPHLRAVLHGLWMEYGSAGLELKLDTRSLTQRLGISVRKPHLEALYQAGFVTFSASSPASSLQAERKQAASLEEKREENPPSSPPSTPERRKRTELTWHCPLDGHDQYYTWTGKHAPTRLHDHLVNLHQLYDADQLADAIEKGTPR